MSPSVSFSLHRYVDIFFFLAEPLVGIFQTSWCFTPKCSIVYILRGTISCNNHTTTKQPPQETEHRCTDIIIQCIVYIQIAPVVPRMILQFLFVQESTENHALHLIGLSLLIKNFPLTLFFRDIDVSEWVRESALHNVAVSGFA